MRIPDMTNDDFAWDAHNEKQFVMQEVRVTGNIFYLVNSWKIFRLALRLIWKGLISMPRKAFAKLKAREGTWILRGNLQMRGSSGGDEEEDGEGAQVHLMYQRRETWSDDSPSPLPLVTCMHDMHTVRTFLQSDSKNHCSLKSTHRLSRGLTVGPFHWSSVQLKTAEWTGMGNTSQTEGSAHFASHPLSVLQSKRQQSISCERSFRKNRDDKMQQPFLPLNHTDTLCLIPANSSAWNLLSLS
jgi:hypothetical protein